MTVSIIISTNQFKSMSNYTPYAKNHQEQQSVKLGLFESVQAAYGEKFYRLKEGTRKAIDMMCWLAAEKGFFFASDTYLAERYEISGKTIRNIAKKLRDHGLIYTVYRRSSTQNGLSAPVHLFTEHPYFSHWKTSLNLEDCQADCQAENNEIPCESKAEQPKKVSTKYLSFTKNLLKILRKENRLGVTYTPGNVPRAFTKEVQPFFGEANDVYTLWGKALLAYKKFNLINPIEEYTSIAVRAFKQTVFAYKHRKIKKDFKGYFYGTLVNMFTYQKRQETFENHPSIFNWLEEKHNADFEKKSPQESYGLAEKENQTHMVWKEAVDR